MNDLPSIGTDIRRYVNMARELAAEGACPKHGLQRALHCGPCASERKVAGPEERREWEAVQKMASCDELFPRRYRDAEPDHPDVSAWVHEAVTHLAEARSLLLLGATGVGKTHLAYGALRAAVLGCRGASWASTTFADFAAALRPQPKKDTEIEMQRYRAVDLLLLDDLAAAKNSEWVEEITYRLINGRYEDMRPTIFTTNLALVDLKEAIGDRVASRLAETCTRVVLDGPDRRRQPRAA
jgi:DNA replication protein DnaC